MWVDKKLDALIREFEGKIKQKWSILCTILYHFGLKATFMRFPLSLLTREKIFNRLIWGVFQTCSEKVEVFI